MDFAPDYPIRTPGLLYDINSYVPNATGGYQTSAPPAKVDLLDRFTSALLVGAQAIVDSNGAHAVAAGSLTKLYLTAGGSSPSDVSGTSYTLATSGYWTFAVMGDTLLAANGRSELQVFTSIGSSTSFVDLAGSPKAKIIFNHENAIVALNIDGNADGWACSDTGDYSQWSAAPNNNADAGDLTGGRGGPITAGTTWQKLAIAWKANCMYGGIRVEEIDQAIRWETIDDTVGCVSPFGWAKTEIGIIFVAQRDIMLFDGSKPRSIADKVRRDFLRKTSANQERIFLSHDELEKNIYFWCNFTTESEGYPKAAFVYNYISGKWGKVPTVNSSDDAFLYLKCPVVEASRKLGAVHYTVDENLVAFTDHQMNWVCGFGGTDSAIVNFAHLDTAKTRNTAGKPSFTTGYIGTHDLDSTLSRVYVIPEQAGTDPESGAITEVREDASTKTSAVSVNDMGMLDGVRVSRYFQASATWPVSTGRQTIAQIIPEFRSGIAKGR